MSSMKVLFIADRFETLDHENDTSLHIARVGLKDFNLEIYWSVPEGIFLDHGKLYVETDGIIRDMPSALQMLTPRKTRHSLSDFHSIHYRKDPPLDIETSRMLNLLSTHQESNIINSPEALLTHNEKLIPLHFSDWAIPSFVSSSRALIQKYIEENLGKKLVIKPFSDAASRNVRLLDIDSVNAMKHADELLRYGLSPVVIQEYDDSIRILGETRVFILNGKIVGTIKKELRQGQSVSNYASSDTVPLMSLSTPDPLQSSRANAIGKWMQEKNIRFATVDFIGPRILEVNITSPGLVHWHDQQVTSLDARIALQYWQSLCS